MLSILQHDCCLRVFKDHPDARGYPAYRHGLLADLMPWAVEQNSLGMGVYFSVNRTDGIGCAAKNITGIRSWFCDIDGVVEPDHKRWKIYQLLSSPLPPSAIVESRNGVHALFYAEPNQPVAPDEYKATNEGIIAAFDGDTNAKDIARVLRLPHTYHRKNPNDPFWISVAYEDHGTMYREADLRKAYPPPQKRKPAPIPWIPTGQSGDIWELILEGLYAWQPVDKSKHKVVMLAVGVGLKFNVPQGRVERDLVQLVSRWDTRTPAHSTIPQNVRWGYQTGEPCSVSALRNLGVPIPRLPRPGQEEVTP